MSRSIPRRINDLFSAHNRPLQTQLKTFGFIFENMCARDLRAYSQNLGGELSYYHDRYGLGSDLVLHLGDGRYALIECKLGNPGNVLSPRKHQNPLSAAASTRRISSIRQPRSLTNLWILRICSGMRMRCGHFGRQALHMTQAEASLSFARVA